MSNYVWESWREHDWLAVDQDGYVGYFMSAHADALPYSVSIPWPYLHNLFCMWIAFCENTTCHNIRTRSYSYDDQVKMLAHSGLFVWDVCRVRAGGECVFRKMAAPVNPIHLDTMPVFFQKIANSFSVSGVSFANVDVLQDVKFENIADIVYHHQCCCDSHSETSLLDEMILNEITISKKLDIVVAIADRCRIDEAPATIGPTFSCWNASRICYSGLITGISSALGCRKIEACDFMGRRYFVNPSCCVAQTQQMQLPYLSVSMPRQDGRNVMLLSSMDDVIGAEVCFPTGYLPSYNNDIHIEDWRFEIMVEGATPPGSVFTRLSRLLSRNSRTHSVKRQLVI